MNSNVSFLIGSGFSLAEGLPSVSDLNKLMKSIDEKDILIHGSQRAYFVEDVPDPNRFVRKNERLFLQEFLKFYCDEYLGDPVKFDYEEFYDFFLGYIDDLPHKKIIEEFYNSFIKKYGIDNSIDLHNTLNAFKRTYSQLLGHHLEVPHHFAGGSWSGYPPYDAFIYYALKLAAMTNVKIHSLNHDMFMDFLGAHHIDFSKKFCDGFELFDSPYYGIANPDYIFRGQKISVGHYVKLERYTGNYNKPISFYKLHGSIGNVVVRRNNTGYEKVRLKREFGIGRFHYENPDEMRMELLSDEVEPDFISGKLSKSNFCNSDPYYMQLFNLFKQNLIDAEFLVVVGYGFQDVLVNEYVEEHFLKKGKPMLVVSPSVPKGTFLDNYTFDHIDGKIEHVCFDDFINKTPASLIKIT